MALMNIHKLVPFYVDSRNCFALSSQPSCWVKKISKPFFIFSPLMLGILAIFVSNSRGYQNVSTMPLTLISGKRYVLTEIEKSKVQNSGYTASVSAISVLMALQCLWNRCYPICSRTASKPE